MFTEYGFYIIIMSMSAHTAGCLLGKVSLEEAMEDLYGKLNIPLKSVLLREDFKHR